MSETILPFSCCHLVFSLTTPSCESQQVLNPTPLNPTPATCNKRKAEVALQFSESCAAEVALQHSLFCSADVIFTKSCVAGKWRFPADFRLPRLGPAERGSPDGLGDKPSDNTSPSPPGDQAPRQTHSRSCRLLCDPTPHAPLSGLGEDAHCQTPSPA